MSDAPRCPACDGPSRVVHEVTGIPVNSCLLVPTRAEALEYPRGDLALAACQACGFLFNARFDPSLSSYSADYEETQAYSERFRDFVDELAEHWTDTYELSGKTAIEIGCGKGEFLVALAQRGLQHGTGIDPGVHPERIDNRFASTLTWVPGFFPADYPTLDAHAVVCRHTLEHIRPVAEFLGLVRDALVDRDRTVLLFELPDVRRVLVEGAFWDVYYEHCSYFSAGSLARLFRRVGFGILDLRCAYDDQYLILEARGTEPGSARRALGGIENDRDEVLAAAERFGDTVTELLGRWRREIEMRNARDERVVVWGGGSKGVAFLAGLGDVARAVDYVVDINPHKQGMFIAGTGHEIDSPQRCTLDHPDLVIAMNPIYIEEIRRTLRDLGVDAEVVAVGA